MLQGGHHPRSWPRRLRKRWLVVTIGSFVGCTDARQHHLFDQPEATLNLVQSHVVEVVDSFPVARVAAGPNGAIALMAEGRSYVLLSDTTGITEVLLNEGALPIAASFFSQGILRDVVDQSSSSIIRFSDRAATQRIALNVIGRVMAAAPSDSGWHVLSISPDATLHYARVTLEHGDVASLRDHVVYEGLDSQPTHVAPLPTGDILFIDARQPHTLWRIDSRQQLHRISLPESSHDGMPMWVGAGLFALNGHVIYTMADLRSDARRILLIRRQGDVLRDMHLQAPMALSAISPDGKHVVGVRHIVGQEIVVYEWARSDNSSRYFSRPTPKEEP